MSELKPFELVTIGKHDGNNGSIDLSKADLEQMVRDYDPTTDPAPFVIGHPKVDHPAWGWAGKIELAGNDRILVYPEKVEPTFAKMVNEGRYRKVSAKILKRLDGTKKLLHIGFLGAFPPAVEGLKVVELAASEEGETFEIELASATFETYVYSILRDIRDMVIEKFGVEDADRYLSSWKLEMLSDSISNNEGVTFSMAVENTDKTVELAAREQDIATKEQALAQREADLEKREAKALEVELAGIIDGLTAEGRVLPAEKPAILTTLRTLRNQPVVELAAGDKSPFDQYVADLNNRPKQVELSAQPEGQAPEKLDKKSIQAKAEQKIELARSQGKEMTPTEAVTEVMVEFGNS